jgi:hypothetical protein
MASYVMKLNRNYVLYTKNGKLLPGGTKVRVNAILNYTDAKKTVSNIRDIAIDEMAIPVIQGKEIDFDTYFQDKVFYKCHFLVINEIGEIVEQPEYVIVWDDVIRADTYYMDHKYGISANLTIKSNIAGNPVFNIDTLIGDIKGFLAKKGVDFQIVNTLGDENTLNNRMEKNLENANETLTRLSVLNTLVPMMEQIASDDFVTKIDGVVQAVTTMETQVNTLIEGM